MGVTCLTILLRNLIAIDGGPVVNLSSGLSLRPMPQYASYSMTRAAIDTFTISLAAEFGSRGITVNTLAPGLTATDMNASEW